MGFQSINPATGEFIAEFPAWTAHQVEHALREAAAAARHWREAPVESRCAKLRAVASVMRQRRESLARLISMEMGKLYREALAEVDKSVWGCEYYAEQGPAFLADELIHSDAARSAVICQPLGTVLAIMPWNFPIWQVFRFAAPALVAGNTGLLKHSANVPQCALAIESVFHDAGVPQGVFRTLMIRSDQVGDVIADARVHAVTLTGSEAAGRKVAAMAGAHLKKTVLELGGSDPFVVLADADLDLTVSNAVASRFLNAGQSCIAAKRFVVIDSIAEEFVARLRVAVEALVPGNPLVEATTLAPMARGDLRDELHQQVVDSVHQGAAVVTGCEPLHGPGFYYSASILDHVRPGMRAFDEELFGPVASIVRARNDDDALHLANQTRFGLAASVWTRDAARGEAMARDIAAGACFVNGMVKSDPRLPFGGIKASGYGRELSRYGMVEFLNIKTLWVR